MDLDKLSTITATPEQLSRIGNLVEYQRKLEGILAQQEEMVAATKKKLRQVTETDIPDALAEAGLAAVTTPDGAEVGVKEVLYASVPKKNMQRACEWLDQHGHGALIKPVLTVGFMNGHQEDMGALAERLINAGYSNVNTGQSVNTGSLKALIRELTEQGEDLPLDLFGAHWVKRSYIKDPK